MKRECYMIDKLVECSEKWHMLFFIVVKVKAHTQKQYNGRHVKEKCFGVTVNVNVNN